MQFTVVTDRAHGVATQGYGQLEVMMHRRNSPTGTISLDDTSIIHAHQAFSLAKWPSAYVCSCCNVGPTPCSLLFLLVLGTGHLLLIGRFLVA